MRIPFQWFASSIASLQKKQNSLIKLYKNWAQTKILLSQNLPLWLDYLAILITMNNKQELMGLLRSFTENVKKFKKLLASESKFEQNEVQFKKIIQYNEQLLDTIPSIFKKIYQSKQDNVSIDKIKKQFESIRSQMDQLLNQYQDSLRRLERMTNKSISVLRKTLTNIHNEIRKSRLQNKHRDEDSEMGGEVQIRMHEVNQQTLHYERMIEIKQKEINQIKGRMVGALKVQEDMKNLVYSQGEKINAAEDNINNANVNVHEAHENLIEGQEQHMASKKKKCCIFGIIVVVLLAILVPIIVKFT